MCFSLHVHSVSDMSSSASLYLLMWSGMFGGWAQPHMRSVIDYMLQANKDPDKDVALESCEFW